MTSYRGRFAPSPTGPLHFGSLVTALGSWLEARSRNGQWLVRMEDLDAPRTVPGAASDMLRTLELFGLHWDGEVVYQSARTDLYVHAFERLRHAGMAFPCACTRREIADSTLVTGAEPVYPGTCRHGLPPGKKARAWRMLAGKACIAFHDAVQGQCLQDLAREVGDYVIRRADGPFAYQLAVVVDDDDQGISHVVRGADLLQSTPRQIYLQRRLGMSTPAYAHLPVAVNQSGEKLSKQTLAPRLSSELIGTSLHAALEFLGQDPPAGMRREDPARLLVWARDHWSIDRVPRCRQKQAPDEYCA